MTLMNLFGSLLAVVILLAPTPLAAQDGPLTDIVEVRLLEGWRLDDGSHMAGLSIRLAPGWKTYWRAPGEAGIPPQLDLAGSDNLAGHALRWPAPEVFWSNGMRSIGYRGDVLLPLHLQAERAGPITLSGELELGVCEDVCIPVRLDIVSVLADGGEVDRRIQAALALRPLNAAEAGAGEVRCALQAIPDGLRLSAAIPVRPQGTAEHVVVEVPGSDVWVAEAQIRRDGGTLHAVTDLVPAISAPFALDRSDLVFTVIGEAGAVELRGCTG